MVPSGVLSAQPSVSIVIPALDEGSWVRRTVEAVRERAGGWPLEVIVVDDGSTDGSCDFLREGFSGNGTVRLIAGGGLGVARARNRGAAAAQGEVLVFMDAHVLPDPGWLEELVGLLRDPSVGLAGVGVRNIEDPQSVGYAYTFVDENLVAGWVAPLGTEPFEAPVIIGCCIGVRRELFQEMGGFDPGHVRWGVEDLEMSLRTWYLGYRCVVSPRAQVAHYFKYGKARNFAVSWEEYDINLLRIAFTYFSGPRVEAIVEGIRRRENFARSWARVMGDGAFWERRAALQRRFRRDEAWYFSRFAQELAPFERRVQEIRKEKGKAMVTERRQVLCPQCGAINVGVQMRCLMCQAPLPLAEEAPQQQPSPPAGPRFCTQCGTRLAAGVRFCTNCGQRFSA